MLPLTALIQSKRQVNWLPLLAGETAYKKTGQWLPDETLSALDHYLVGIKGPLTTPLVKVTAQST